MLLAAAQNLTNEKDRVNALNVFPVPDGDTGTNMALTLTAAVKELDKIDSTNINKMTGAVARGSLMGARGNSGVILSQFFRGFSDGLVNTTTTANGEDLARALQKASETTYRAVMKPVEGTILTVGKQAAKAATEAFEEGAGAEKVLAKAVTAAKKALANTPNILPVLKEAGVVDAGGQGLVCILEGFLVGLRNDGDLDFSAVQVAESTSEPVEQGISRIEGVLVNKYCTEFLILGDGIDTEKVKNTLEPKGDSMLVVGDGGVVKIHVHTDHPGEVLEYCSSLGNLTDIKIENMQLQNEHYTDESNLASNVISFPQPTKEKTHKPLGVVAVVPGEGLAEIFTSLGVDVVVTGGQTMNPSTEELVQAVNQVNADSVIILPNNKNVIFSAQQVKELTSKGVGVVPTRSVPQGIAALMSLHPEGLLADNVVTMEQGMKQVKTGEITYAVRATVAGDLQIEEQDIIGLAEGKIAVAGRSISTVTQELIEKLVDDDTTIISLYCGDNHDFGEAQEFAASLEAIYPDCDIELYEGGQPLYYYIVSVE